MDTTERILQVALEMFNRKGYVQVGVREIARELDISPGNLSYHFPKKEDILYALLERLHACNSGIYERYLAGQPSLSEFLSMMKELFYSQFDFRGVFISKQVIQRELKGGSRFDYPQVAVSRLDTYRRIFRDLHEAGEMQLSEEDLDFLVSFMGIFGRFWISEALLPWQKWNREEAIDHYLSLLSKQLSLFVSNKH